MDYPSAVPSERKTTMRLSCPPGAGKVKGYGVGDAVALGVTGKVVSVRADEYDECLEVEVAKVDDGGPKSLTKAMRARKANGRFA